MVYTTPTKKARIVQLKEQGLTNQAVATHTQVHPSTVSRIYAHYGRTQKFYNVKPKSGWPRKLTTSEAQTGLKMLANGTAQDATDLQRKLFLHVGTDTVRRRLKELGLRAFKRRKKPLLTNRHKDL